MQSFPARGLASRLHRVTGWALSGSASFGAGSMDANAARENRCQESEDVMRAVRGERAAPSARAACPGDAPALEIPNPLCLIGPGGKFRTAWLPGPTPFERGSSGRVFGDKGLRGQGLRGQGLRGQGLRGQGLRGQGLLRGQSLRGQSLRGQSLRGQSLRGQSLRGQGQPTTPRLTITRVGAARNVSIRRVRGRTAGIDAAPVCAAHPTRGGCGCLHLPGLGCLEWGLPETDRGHPLAGI
jgi:hypothetical protein